MDRIVVAARAALIALITLATTRTWIELRNISDSAVDLSGWGVFIELGNYGSTPVDIGGWKIIGCRVDGFRDTDTLVTVWDETTIAPGRTCVAASLPGERCAGCPALELRGTDIG